MCVSVREWPGRILVEGAAKCCRSPTPAASGCFSCAARQPSTALMMADARAPVASLNRLLGSS